MSAFPVPAVVSPGRPVSMLRRARGSTMVTCHPADIDRSGPHPTPDGVRPDAAILPPIPTVAEARPERRAVRDPGRVIPAPVG